MPKSVTADANGFRDIAVNESITPQNVTDAAIITAEKIGLRYVSDSNPGIGRKWAKKAFTYIDAFDKPIKDKDRLNRIKALGIPPAWTQVWICPLENGHIQATGRDAKNRKQYRYHARFREVRDEAKFERMIGFGKALPLIRQGVEAALALPGLPREKVLATVVYLLQTTMIRVGNDEYARQNQSYGLTTLRNRHVRIDGSEVAFHFRGKSGVEHAIHVHDKRLARIIKRIRDLPGQELFQYIDENGQRHSISSTDTNDYIRELTGESYTAKDFRTWSGSLLAAIALHELEAFDSETQAKKNVLNTVEAVAKKLGNTPAICRKCYIHPLIFTAYLNGSLGATLKKRINTQVLLSDRTSLNSAHALSEIELALLDFLKEEVA